MILACRCRAVAGGQCDQTMDRNDVYGIEVIVPEKRDADGWHNGLRGRGGMLVLWCAQQCVARVLEENGTWAHLIERRRVPSLHEQTYPEGRYHGD
jgi:hypothetical protein